MSKSTAVYDTIVRQHQLKRMRRMKQITRYRLRTLFLLTTAVALLSALVGLWKAAIMDHVEIRWQQTTSSLSAMPVSNVAWLLGVFCGILAGAMVSGITYRLDEKRGYLLFSVMSLIGLFALITALSLGAESLTKTELQNLHANQIARIVLLWFACVVPLSTFLGWYISISTNRDY